MAILKKYDFLQSYSDYSLFTYCKNLIRHIYVEDLIIYGNDSFTIVKLKEYLNKYFHMKDFGILKYFLGIEMTYGPKRFFLYQRKYALNFVTKILSLGAKLVSAPIE